MATLPEAAASAAPRVGLDVGGSSIKAVAGFAGAPPQLTARRRFDRPGEDVLGSLMDSIVSLIGDEAPASVGVTVPGIVEAGVVRASSNIPQLVGLDVAGELSRRLGVQVSVTNDGTAAALAEARVGAGRGSEDAFIAVLGTGIAGAHVIGGQLLPGAHGQAGELGHLRVPESNALCSCGAIGCLETVIGAPALAASWTAASGQGGGLEGLQAGLVSGHAGALRVLEHAAEALASGLLLLSALVDPARVVVGGGVAEALPSLVPRAGEVAAERATFHQLPELVTAEFGAWSGAVGAMLL